jgi:hypothetical protein
MEMTTNADGFPLDTDLFAPVGVRPDEADKIKRKSQTYLQDASGDLKKTRLLHWGGASINPRPAIALRTDDGGI